MINQDTASSLLTLARSRGADFAELYVERWKKRSLRVVKAEVAEANSGIEFGCGLRLFYGNDVVYAYTNDLSESALTELANTLTSLRGEAGRVNAQGAGGLDFREQTAAGLHEPLRPLSSESKGYRLERLLELDAAAQIDSRVQQVDGRLDEWEQDVLVANSEGVWVTDHRVRARLRALAVASDGAETQTGVVVKGFMAGLDIFDKLPPGEAGKEAARQALTLLTAKKAPATTMPVVIGSGFGGVIFHEALGHLVETTSVAKGASVLSDKLGEQVASPCVTYLDDGTLPHLWGSTEFDDEGAKTKRTVLIRNGVLESYMVDKLGGLKTGYEPTGSGRRQDYTFAPTSRMRNTFIAPGSTPKADLFSGIDYGLYAKDMGGGQVSPGTGDYNFGVREAYIIRDGQIEEPVRGAMLVGKGPDTISKVVAVSGDLAHKGGGMCGSKSGAVPTGIGQPHLLVSELVVGGEAA